MQVINILSIGDDVALNKLLNNKGITQLQKSKLYEIGSEKLYIEKWPLDAETTFAISKVVNNHDVLLIAVDLSNQASLKYAETVIDNLRAHFSSDYSKIAISVVGISAMPDKSIISNQDFVKKFNQKKNVKLTKLIGNDSSNVKDIFDNIVENGREIKQGRNEKAEIAIQCNDTKESRKENVDPEISKRVNEALQKLQKRRNAPTTKAELKNIIDETRMQLQEKQPVFNYISRLFSTLPKNPVIQGFDEMVQRLNTINMTEKSYSINNNGN